MLTGLNINLSDIARAVQAAPGQGYDGIIPTGISSDTRTIRPGDLFFALSGEHFDGNDFLPQAFAKGAVAAVARNGASVKPEAICLTVPDTMRALGDLAAYIRRQHSPQIIAVTGSNGKTTTKEMLVRILRRKYGINQVLASQGNFNNLIGLPLTLFKLTSEHEVAVLEMGMSAFGEIARLTQIAAPNVGLITNVGPSHLQGLGNLQGVARAKGELFSGLDQNAIAVVNMDDPLLVSQSKKTKADRISFGFASKADIRISGVKPKGLAGDVFRLITPDGSVEIQYGLMGRHNLSNAMAAAAGAWALGLKIGDIADGLADFPPFPGRLEVKYLAGHAYLLDDTYNANPNSTRAALNVLKAVKGKGRAIAVLGDMLELGSHSRDEHRRIGTEATRLGLDIFLTVGSEARHMGLAAREAGFPFGLVRWFPDAETAADWLKTQIQPHDRILVKGSRGMHMEKAVTALTGEALA